MRSSLGIQVNLYMMVISPSKSGPFLVSTVCSLTTDLSLLE